MRALLAFAVLAVAALLTFLLWPEAAAAPAHGVENVTAAAAPKVPTEPVTTTPAQPAEPAANAPQRQVAMETFDGPTGNVRVVKFGTDTPVAGAIVRYQPPDFDWQKLPREQVQELQELQKDLERFLQRVGRESVTDADGRCRVPLGKYGAQLSARSGELYGQGYLVGKQDDVQLALRPDRALVVVTVDERGQAAADIKLKLEQTSSSKDAARWVLGQSDAQGRYVQPHVQTIAGDNAAFIAQLSACPAGGAGPPVSVDLVEPPPEVVLRLGPTGAVLVRALDAAGQPLDPKYLDSPTVSLTGFDKRPDRDQENASFSGFNNSNPEASLDVGGTARFPCVALGRYLIVSLGSFVNRKSFEGPTAANPQIEVTVQEAAEGAMFTGTLLGADGAAFANRPFMIAGSTGHGSASQQFRTDERGRFRCYLGTYLIGDSVTLTLGGSQTYPPAEDAMRVELPPRKVQAGINDLGEVRLVPERPLLSGRLVREDGVTAASVQLDIERRHGERWSQEWQLQPQWHPDGSFTVRGAVPEKEPLRLVVREGPYLPVQPIECKAGDTGIEIPLRAGGSVTAEFLVDEHLPIERMQFRLRRIQPPEKPDSRASMMERYRFMGQTQVKDGKLPRQWSGLAPGSYELAVTCPGSAGPVVRIDAIAVTSGPCSDPRLTDIDLRNRVTTFEVRATDAAGQPVASNEAFVVTRSQGDDWYGYNLGRGMVTLAAPAPLDLYVLAPGHKMAAVEAVRESRTVALERAEDTLLQVELPAPLPEGVEFHLRLRPKLEFSRRAHITLDTGRGMDLESFFVQDVLLAADGIAKVSARCPGEHSIAGMVSVSDRGGTYVRDFTPKTVVLPAGPGTILKVDAKGLESALQSMRR